MKDMWEDIKNDLLKTEESLSDDAWSKMASELDRAKPKKRFPFLRFFSILGLLLMGFGIGVFINPENFLNPKIQSPPSFKIQDDITLDKSALDSVNEYNKIFLEELIDPVIMGQTLLEKEKNISSSASTKIEENKEDKNTHKKRVRPFSTVENPSTISNEKNFVNNKPLRLILMSKPIIFSADTFAPLELLSFPSLNPSPRKSKSDFGFSKIPKFQLKMFGGPSYSLNGYKHIPDQLKTNRNYLGAVKDEGKSSLGFEYGMEFYYRFYKNIRIGSGFAFQKISTYSSFDYEIFEIPVIEGSSGEILAYITLPESRKVDYQGTNSFQFLSIPLSFYHERRIHKKWLWSAEFTQHFGFLNQHSSTQVNQQTLELKQTQSSELNTFISSSSLNCGFHYQLSPMLLIGIEPRISYAYQNIFNQEINSWKPLQMGLNLSTTINFTNP